MKLHEIAQQSQLCYVTNKNRDQFDDLISTVPDGAEVYEDLDAFEATYPNYSVVITIYTDPSQDYRDQGNIGSEVYAAIRKDAATNGRILPAARQLDPELRVLQVTSTKMLFLVDLLNVPGSVTQLPDMTFHKMKKLITPVKNLQVLQQLIASGV